MAGTRPGGAIAAAWAVIQFLGVEGYRAKQKTVTDTRGHIEAGVTQQGWDVIGAPQLGLLAFTRGDVAPLAVLKEMYRRGWVSTPLTEPAGIHLMLSPVHAEVADQYLADLASAVYAVRSGAGGDAARPVSYGA